MDKKEKKLPSFLVQEETPAEAALREACDAFVERACDAIRRSLDEEKTAGNLRHDCLNGEKTNPHYRTCWTVEVDVDFKKKDTFHEIDGSTLRFGFAIPVFYVLEQMERRLAVEQIHPVKQRQKRVGLFRKAVGMETARVRLHRPEVCNGLDAASRDYSAGFTAPHLGFELQHEFAFFLEEAGA